MKTLKLEHLAPYLPYKLRILNGWGDIREMKYTHLDDDGNSGNIQFNDNGSFGGTNDFNYNKNNASKLSE
jgi:hypothetical protein